MDIKELNIKKLEPLAKVANSRYNNYEVIGIDKDNNKIFDKISQAVNKLKSIKGNKSIAPSGIFKCASNYYPKYYGYEWRFFNEEDQNNFDIFKSKEARDNMLNLNPINRKKLVAYDSDGSPAQAFENIFEAILWLKKEKNLKVDYKSILFVASNHNNRKKAQTAKGFRWRFLDDVLIDNQDN